MRPGLLAGAAWWLLAGPAAADELEELLQRARQQGMQEQAEQRVREQDFATRQLRWRERLETEQAALEKERERGRLLKREYQSRQELLQTQERQLQRQLGTLGELLGVTRQVAGDIGSLLDSSLVSAQRPGRAATARKLADGEELPSVPELRALWLTALEEMAAAGKIVRFEAGVIGADGAQAPRQVTRVGVFNAVAEGRFLQYLPGEQRLSEPPQQPSPRQQRMARALERAEDGLHPFPLDPTRGTLLALRVHDPGLVERLRQGGSIGYLILALAAVAALLIAERAATLGRMRRRIQAQLGQPPRPDNPLGRVLLACSDPKEDEDGLPHRLEEALLHELPLLRRGLGTLAVLAAVAPLLGLLGTVVGIIETFQSITLFGTGDPRVMAGGISQALVTTVLGLLVAIPALLAHSLLNNRSNGLLELLEREGMAQVATRFGGNAAS